MNSIKYLYVYILKCSDGVYYTGVTNDYKRRLYEHDQGVNKSCYTYVRRPVEMVYCEAFTDFKLAISWEKRIKDWSRKKKEALIEKNWVKLKEYASCINGSSHKTLLDSARSDNPSAAQGDNPSAAQGDNPSTTQGNIPSATQGNNPSAAQGNNPSKALGGNSSVAPVGIYG